MNNNPNKEKILKGLIIIGIIAILVSVYLQYLKLFIDELQTQKRDLKRIEELTLINSALNELQKENPDVFLGEPDKVYISIPSTNFKCEGLELPSLLEGWEYRCKPKTEYEKIDGNGWIPVDFTKLSDNSFFKLLPADPINSANDLFYYTYTAGEGWVLTSLLGSNKFLKQSALNDGGTDPARFEIGSDLRLWAKPSGLVGYWKFDEGKGTTAADSSGQGNKGTITEATYVAGMVGTSLDFNGTNDYVDCGNKTNFEFATGVSFTLSVWYKGTWLEGTVNGLITKGYHSITSAPLWYMVYLADNPTYGSGTTGDIRVGFLMTDAVGATVIDPWGLHSITNVGDGNWHHLVVVVNKTTDKAYIYVDGNLEATGDITSDVDVGVNTDPLVLMNHHNRFTKGTIDEVRIYNRALNTKEIK